MAYETKTNLKACKTCNISDQLKTTEWIWCGKGDHTIHIHYLTCKQALATKQQRKRGKKDEM